MEPVTGGGIFGSLVTRAPMTVSRADMLWPTPCVPSQVPFLSHWIPQADLLGPPLHCAAAAFALVFNRAVMLGRVKAATN